MILHAATTKLNDTNDREYLVPNPKGIEGRHRPLAALDRRHLSKDFPAAAALMAKPLREEAGSDKKPTFELNTKEV
jgi:hypothetical protein